MYRLINVTGGVGGDCHLLIGKEKTAIVDTGMAYCAATVIDNIKKALAEHMPEHPQLDYIFLTHSHYDHLGALPYILEAWPGAKVCAAAHAQKVLQRPNALKTIRRLSEGACIVFGDGHLPPYDDAAMRVDVCLKDRDVIDLGSCPVMTLETPGHTQCSLTFFVDHDLVFGSESTGYTSKCGRVNTTFVNSYKQAVASIEKCRALGAVKIVSPHYGLLSDEEASVYWQKCLEATEYHKNFILDAARSGCSEEAILEACFHEFYDEICKFEQPYRAWKANTLAAIRTVLEEFDITADKLRTASPHL